ncbi:hypothetical protein SAMN05216345_12610 [Cupriavidus sp. YR651]|uniref:hypothetical protein n=1 Tax=Cupriavidus sp. YR651 TaxID=1855315 RepID=UPI00088A38C5|nr:hypothetical protein [Cupriavidus sp. YR651]SDD97839.1 hypothetical protein SAMN05216345_12610 [Cupriavidus sp. YR651]
MNSLAQRAEEYGQGLAAIVLALAVLMPPIRKVVETSMALHMLLQFPVLLLAGGLLAGQLPGSWLTHVARWNAYGATGLALVGLNASLGMVPRLLDLALTDARVEVMKCLALALCGIALRLSWRRAGVIVQGFFLGNVLPMMAIAGSLYIDTPLRLCNQYRLDEQLRVGQSLIWLAGGVGALWLARAVWLFSREDAPARTRNPPGNPCSSAK